MLGRSCGVGGRTGIPPSYVAAHAHTLGLTIRRGVDAHKHVLTIHGGPETFSAPVWASFTRPGADNRIRRLLTIPGHANLNEAAKHLGIKKVMLLHQLRQVEDDVGAALINLDGAPVITLTPAGEQFAGEVRPVLTMLERHRNQPAPPSP